MPDGTLGQTSHHCDQREQHHFERSEKHHIAVGDASFDILTVLCYNKVKKGGGYMGILEKISIVIAGLAIIAFFVIMFILVIKQEKAEKARRGGKSLKEFLAEEEAKRIAMLEDDSEIQYTEVNATIQDMRCGVALYGIKSPKTVKEFYITYLTNNGETFDIMLDEESYLAVSVGDRITLYFNGDVFCGFTKQDELP